MEAALDSPLEALAINYLAYGFFTAVNNIWAWIAVITAAVSFWRIRAPPALTTTTSQDSTMAEELESDQSVSTSTESAPAVASCRVLERQGSTKMKFSLYYKEEAEVEEEDLREDDEDGDGENEEGGAAVAVLGGDWEGMMAMRMGDLGWYRWQDRMVLDGSVVRLWERKHAAALVVNGGDAW